MTPEEIQVLQQACKAAGVNASKIRPLNPFTKSGSTASMIQAAVAEFAPEQAAKWRCDAGGGLSVQTLAEMQSGGDLSQAAMNDLWLHDPVFVADKQREQSSVVEKQLKWLDAEADKKRRAREGDKAVDAQIAKAAAERDAREESLSRHNDLQRRIEQRQQQVKAMHGGFVQS